MRSILQLDTAKLSAALTKAAGPDTAYCGEYNPARSPLHNHCGAVSYTVRNLVGGVIVSGVVVGVTHYWNRLPDGSELDFTSDQFGGDGLNPLQRGRVVPERTSINMRFLIYEDRVKRVLGIE